MKYNQFKRLECGKYKDSVTSVLLIKECENNWTINIDDFSHCAFVTRQWGEALATYKISGFRTMKDAKQYDFLNLFRRTGTPYKNKKGVTISVPVTGLGSVPVVSSFSIKDLALRQGYLF